MSNRADTYLNLCLEQAANSPLHYRHGSIVVRGGKVVGGGFNDHLVKQRHQCGGGGMLCVVKNRPSRYRVVLNTKPGCGESALNGTSSVSLPRQDPHQPLTAVRTLAVRCLMFKGGVLKGLHLNQINDSSNKANLGVKKKKDNNNNLNETESAAKRPNNDENRSLPLNPTKESLSSHKIASRLPRHEVDPELPNPLHRSSDATTKDVRLDSFFEAPAAPEKCEKRYKRRQKLELKHQAPVAQSKPAVVTAKPSTHRRKKYPRLQGADLYVVRLGSSLPAKTEPKGVDLKVSPTTTDVRDSYVNAGDVSIQPETRPMGTTSQSSGSLHDELSFHFGSSKCERNSRATSEESDDRNIDTETVASSSNSTATPVIRNSRPCYRCIETMHSVGIKRVFWTTSTGEWEGGKVHELVEELQRYTGGCGGNADESGDGKDASKVFVTKHEVLQLKRKMMMRKSS